MKQFLIVALAITVFVIILCDVTEIVMQGGFISKKTEQRYLTAIRSHEPNTSLFSNRTWFFPKDYKNYCSIFKNTYCFVNPLSKWHIQRGKMIPRWSELHRVLDSMESEYKKKPIFNPAE